MYPNYLEAQIVNLLNDLPQPAVVALGGSVSPILTHGFQRVYWTFPIMRAASGDYPSVRHGSCMVYGYIRVDEQGVARRIIGVYIDWQRTDEWGIGVHSLPEVDYLTEQFIQRLLKMVLSINILQYPSESNVIRVPQPELWI